MAHPARTLVVALLLAFVSAGTHAADAASRDLQALKQSVLDVNKELTSLEQQLLYPSTQVAMFLSIDVGTPIRLVDINLVLDNKNVGYHFYTDQEFQALTKGGISRLYTGNVTSGEHTLRATITGYDPQGKDYQRSTAYKFVKGAGRKMIELKVVDDVETRQHKFEFKEWSE
ncbi:MAG: hypothetical protein ACOY3X_07240 [Pseudomonadota bacterium]